MPGFTSIAYWPSLPLFAHTGGSVVTDEFAHASAPATVAFASSRIRPEIRCSGASSIQSAASPVARSLTRSVSAQRCSDGPVTRTKYVPGAPLICAAPSLPVSAQLSALRAVDAHTWAPATGPPASGCDTSTRRVTVDGGTGEEAGGVPAVLHAVRMSARATTLRTATRRDITTGITAGTRRGNASPVLSRASPPQPSR